jgi:hypothetical protein
MYYFGGGRAFIKIGLLSGSNKQNPTLVKILAGVRFGFMGIFRLDVSQLVL